MRSRGVARTTTNFVLNVLGTAYVELFRNVPLILQGFFWYAVMTRLPPPKKAIAVGDSVFLSSRGIYLPWLDIGWPEALAVVAVLALTLVLARVLCRSWFRGWSLAGPFAREESLPATRISGAANSGRPRLPTCWMWATSRC